MAAARFTVEAGLLARVLFRNWLQNQLTNKNVRMTFSEKRCLFNSVFGVEVDGNPVMVEAWCLATRDLVDEWDGDWIEA